MWRMGVARELRAACRARPCDGPCLGAGGHHGTMGSGWATRFTCFCAFCCAISVLHPKAPAVGNFACLSVGAVSENPHVARSRLFKPDSERYFPPREVHPASEMGCKHRQNRLFPGVCDLAPKARKTFFTKVRSQRTHFFVHRHPQGIYTDLTLKLQQREQTTGTTPFRFPCVLSPI